MPELSIDDFPEFFAAMNDGHRPFQWQLDLMRYVVENNAWPGGIHAPTGAGKSCFVDVHVFANALSAVQEGFRPPRRMTVVVNRRALVDSHFDHADAIRKALGGPSGYPRVVQQVADALLRHGAAEPLHTMRMRGGAPVERDWLNDPRQCMIISATPDMAGSRLLLRGYGSNPRSRPREAGFLGHDNVMVLDESHLSRQLLVTARSVARLVQAEPVQLGVPGLQVVATTATPSDDVGTSVGVDPDHLARDTELEHRLTRPKPVTYVETPEWPTTGKASAKYVAAIAEEAVKLRELVCQGDSQAARTVGVVVNSVKAAVAVADALRKSTPQVQCWVGPMRPLDLDGMKQRHKNLFTVAGDDSVHFLVATQTVEVGIDLDWAGLVTELAAGPALAQRAGRVNRLGRRGSSPVVVLGPPAAQELKQDKSFGAYRGDDLTAAREWVLQRAADPLGLAPMALQRDPAPEAALRRTHTKRVELADAWYWSRSSEHLAADPALELWLRDDLDPEEPQAGLVVRDYQHLDLSSALATTDILPPHPSEVFPLNVSQTQRAVTRALKTEGTLALIHREGENLQLLDPDNIQPGDVVVLSTTAPLVTMNVVTDENPTESPNASLPPEAHLVRRERDAEGEPKQELLQALAYVVKHPPHEDLSKAIQERFAEWAAENGDEWDGCIVTVPPPGLEPEDTSARFIEPQPLPWIVIQPDKQRTDSEDLRSEWAGASEPVLLDAHNRAVADRARVMAERIGLTPELAHAMHDAGLAHDLGKRDPRFQQVLRNNVQDAVWAKGRPALGTGRRISKSQVGLGSQWRHEQLSVLLMEDASGQHQDLVHRLVGTSHGWGRPMFPHTFTQLRGELGTAPWWSDVESRGRELFDDGEWSALMAATDRRYGVWGCAYLEAVLRAADCSVSAEGS